MTANSSDRSCSPLSHHSVGSFQCRSPDNSDAYTSLNHDYFQTKDVARAYQRDRKSDNAIVEKCCKDRMLWLPTQPTNASNRSLPTAYDTHISFIQTDRIGRDDPQSFPSLDGLPFRQAITPTSDVESTRFPSNLSLAFSADQHVVSPECKDKQSGTLQQYESIHQQYKDRIPVSKDYYKTFYAEFGELFQEKYMSSQGAKFGFLHSQWEKLEQNAKQNCKPLENEDVLKILGDRRSSKNSSPNNPPIVIKDCQFALGDSTKERTFATTVLRICCASAMFEKDDKLTEEECSAVLHDARRVLDEVFCSEGDRGEMFYQVPRKGQSPYTSSQATHAISCHHNCKFARVKKSQEVAAVMHLARKLQPSTEISLPTAIDYYRLALQYKEPFENVIKFEAYLDFAEKSMDLDVTPCAIKGIKNTLKTKWKELFPNNTETNKRRHISDMNE